jgi:hypothetical protein
MRTSNHDFDSWLLHVGDGSLAPISPLPAEKVQIPDHMIIWTSLIEDIFGNLERLSIAEMADRVNLATKNKTMLNINSEIIGKLPGNTVTCANCFGRVHLASVIQRT